VSLWAVVPVKPLEESKSRLAGALSQAERSALARSLLERTLRMLAATPEVALVLVVSRDPAVLKLARDLGAGALREDCPPELNASLEFASRYAAEHGAGAVLALPADLPLVTPEDIAALAALAARDPAPCAPERPPGPSAVIAPDRRREGTNALLVRPPGALPYRFGPDSFARHCAEARRLALRLEICERPALALDIDLPEDLEYLKGNSVG